MSQSLTQIGQEYQDKRPDLKWASRDSARIRWKRFVKIVGDKDGQNLCYADGENFKAQLFRDGMKPKSVESFMKTVKAMVNWAARRKYCPRGVFSEVRLPKVPKRQIRIYTDAEVFAILDRVSNIQRRALIMTAWTAGLRPNELLHLTVNDVDFERELIFVQSKDRTRQTLEWVPKNWQIRQVPLITQRRTIQTPDGKSKKYPSTADLLAKLLNEVLLDKHPYWFLTEKQYDTAMHTTCERTQNKLTEHWKWFGQARRAAKVKDATFYDLRRTRITIWAKHLALPYVQYLAGHESIKTTELYIAKEPDRACAEAKRIGATGLEPATS